MKIARYLLTLLLFTTTVSCDFIFLADTIFTIVEANEEAEKIAKEEKREAAKHYTGVYQKKDEEGNVTKEITYEDGIKNGMAREYYPNGQLYKEIYYVNGQQEDTVKMYHRNGNRHRFSVYENGKRNGVHIRYFKSGNERSRMTYVNDTPMPDLVEKNTFGDLIAAPEIVVTEENLLQEKDQYILHFQLDDNTKRKVEFYALEKEGDWIIPSKRNGGKALTVENDKSKGILPLTIPKSYLVDTDFYIFAQFSSPAGNDWVITKKLHISVENHYL